MKLTKNFRIKTPEGFTDVINFLSESVYFKDGRNLDTRIQNEVDTLNNRIDTEVDTLEKADAAEKKAREDEIVRVEGLITAEQEARVAADNTLTTNLNKEIQDRIDAVNDEKTARESAVNNINTKIGSVDIGDSLTAAIKANQESINTINNTMIPGLQQSINTINETTIPNVSKEISDLTAGPVKTNTDNISNLQTKVFTLESQNLDTRLKALEEDNSVETINQNLESLTALVGGSSLEEGKESILARLEALELLVDSLINNPTE